MSVQSLYTAATGMQAMETKLDVVANNLANINTTAYKRTRANFEDLFYRQIKLPGAQDAQGNFTPTGIAVGLGTRVQSTQTDFSQGAFRRRIINSTSPSSAAASSWCKTRRADRTSTRAKETSRSTLKA
ncbi:MAG: flagellar hook-basal body complex protein [Pirellulales bacterium]